MARQVVSYSDLDAPYSAPRIVETEVATQPMASASNQPSSPPMKKRKRDEVNGKDDIKSQLSLPPKPPVIKKQKRGRKNKRNRQEYTSGTALVDAHWDDPGLQVSGISYDEDYDAVGANADYNNEDGEWEDDEYHGDAAIADENHDEEEEDESRDLTHEEIWDDSALIAAWDAANEEYEALHGKNKRWKKERVHKSPLWYNIPPEKPSTKSKGKGKSKQESAVPKAATTPAVQTLSGLTEAEDNQSSAPLNFDTFVPTHDPSLTFTGPSSPPPLPQNTQSHLGQIQNYYESILPPPGNAAYTTTGGMGFTANTKGAGVGTINADEAFNRAIGAMYWCGYWTAMYHVQRAHERVTDRVNFTAENNQDSPIEDEEETELLVSTQR
ncbi:hypothetical protein PNOK_0169000 [Pyrrhoderma noxium]|uniref:Survival Motor Neuron Gemin2-binding domain-containing protein n=1 Tax=Pyrrhoderma noxium TaxID=2282107 RepID=A0A286UQ52_9AGAM|nr:hypothetical protein PNOK_0169000 [Pyrrhoderma noxium]